MDVDVNALRALVREKELSWDLVVDSIEQALLRTAYVDQVNEQKTRDWLPLRVYALYPHTIGSRSGYMLVGWGGRRARVGRWSGTAQRRPDHTSRGGGDVF